MNSRKELGDAGEQAVSVYLARRGYRLSARQFRCRFGEIDLIAWSPEGTLCFVEVKTRARASFAQAREAVTAGKRRKLRSAAEYYLMWKGLDCPCRFDVAEVYPGRDGADARIEYIINAF